MQLPTATSLVEMWRCTELPPVSCTSTAWPANGLLSEILAQPRWLKASGITAVSLLTGGKVIVLGKTGKNFGAGMSGGIAYVYDEDGTFASRFNADSADLDPLDTEDQEWLTAMLRCHIELTASQRAEDILSSWQLAAQRFVKVSPGVQAHC